MVYSFTFNGGTGAIFQQMLARGRINRPSLHTSIYPSASANASIRSCFRR